MILRHVITRLLSLLLPALLLMAFAARAQDNPEVGIVTFAFGPIELIRAQASLPVAAGTALREGDRLVTAASGSAQLRMIDGALISVRPASTLHIERYRFDGQTAAEGNAVLELVQGTMRAFTGQLVRLNRDSFKMKTAFGLIGIRGSGNVLAHNEQFGTLNHTLTGAHSVTSTDAAGVTRTLVSLPGQTIQIKRGQAPKFVPTPAAILAAATAPTTQASATGEGSQTEPVASDVPLALAASATAAASNPLTATASAAVTTAINTLTAWQLPNDARHIGVRFSVPYSGGGYEGFFAQGQISGQEAQFDANGALTRIDGVPTCCTFLSGGAQPAGYQPFNANDVTLSFSGGTVTDLFRTPDHSLVQGRWVGGQVSITSASGTTVYDLGPRSAFYRVVAELPYGVFAGFTGNASYSLSSPAAATRPTDGQGTVGQLSSASVAIDFASLAFSLAANISFGGQSFSLGGNGNFVQDQNQMSLIRRTGFSGSNLSISCSGSGCANGYEGVTNLHLAGPNGAWLMFDYRFGPQRSAGGAFPEQITGTAALAASSPPSTAISLPKTGSTALVIENFVDQSGLNLNPPPSITGTLNANFSTQTVGFNATLAASGAPTLNASASNVPIVGVGFSTSTTPNAPDVGQLTLACSANCGTTGFRGFINGMFTNSAGTAGKMRVGIGRSTGGQLYVGTATLR